MKDMLILSVKIFLLFLFLALISLAFGYHDLFYIFGIVGLLMSGVTFFSIYIIKQDRIKKQHSINTIFFDLDGTLLPFELDHFIKKYFSLISTVVTKAGYDSKLVLTAIKKGTDMMVNNNGEKNNEEVFWQTFCSVTNIHRDKIEPLFSEFYLNDFNQIKEITKPNPVFNELVKTLKEKGYKLILATNPVFPLIATKQRIAWAGLDFEDFEYISSYENSYSTKPNESYYNHLFKIANVESNQVLMIGNDADEDGVIESLGASCFILTDCIINSNNRIVKTKYCGDLTSLKFLINNLPTHTK